MLTIVWIWDVAIAFIWFTVGFLLHALIAAGKQWEVEQCSHCDGRGWVAEWDKGGGPPEQVMCVQCDGLGKRRGP